MRKIARALRGARYQGRASSRIASVSRRLEKVRFSDTATGRPSRASANAVVSIWP
jgi:hypothetical protein